MVDGLLSSFLHILMCNLSKNCEFSRFYAFCRKTNLNKTTKFEQERDNFDELSFRRSLAAE